MPTPNCAGRNGIQNLLLPSSSALKTDLHMFMFRAQCLPAVKGFDRRFYHSSRVWGAVSTGVPGMISISHQNAYLLCWSSRKRKFVESKMAAKSKKKLTFSATVRYHCQTSECTANSNSSGRTLPLKMGLVVLC